MKPLPPALLEKFHVEDHGDKWHLECRACRQRWSLAKRSTHGGNTLALLNHAAKHEGEDR